MLLNGDPASRMAKHKMVTGQCPSLQNAVKQLNQNMFSP